MARATFELLNTDEGQEGVLGPGVTFSASFESNGKGAISSCTINFDLIMGNFTIEYGFAVS